MSNPPASGKLSSGDLPGASPGASDQTRNVVPDPIDPHALPAATGAAAVLNAHEHVREAIAKDEDEEEDFPMLSAKQQMQEAKEGFKESTEAVKESLRNTKEAIVEGVEHLKEKVVVKHHDDEDAGKHQDGVNKSEKK